MMYFCFYFIILLIWVTLLSVYSMLLLTDIPTKYRYYCKNIKKTIKLQKKPHSFSRFFSFAVF